MEKSTDSSTSPTTSSSSVDFGGLTSAASNKNNTTTSSDANRKQISQKQEYQSQSIPKSDATSTKSQLKNSLGCGSLPTTTIASKSSSQVRGGCSSYINVGSISNLKSSNISSLATATLGHQSLSNTSITNRSASSNTASSSFPASTSNPKTNASPSTLLSTEMAHITLNISTTTGGNFSVSVDPLITVENLKKIISKKLKVAKDRICLLHRDKELQDGLLKDNNLMDGSKVILIPNVETGLLTQKPENTVMQALESLNDSQVNDFLSGKTPLNLSMRLGDHMMLIQLQLSTVHPVNGAAYSGANCGSSSSRQRTSHHHHHNHRSSRTAATASAATQTSGTATFANHSHHHHHHHHHHHSSNTVLAGTATTGSTLSTIATTTQNVTGVRKLEVETTCQTPRNNSHTSTLIAPNASRAAKNINSSTSPSMSTCSTATKNSDLNSFLSKRDFESLQNIVKSIAMAEPSRLVKQSITTGNKTTKSLFQTSSIVLPTTSSASVPVVTATSFHASSEAILEQSPIKSLSNLVSSPIKTTALKNIPKMSNNVISSSTNKIVSLGPHTALISAIPAASSNGSTAAVNSVMCQDPIAAKLTSCLCTRLNGGTLEPVSNSPHNSAKQCIDTTCVSQQQVETVPHNLRQQQLQPQTTLTNTTTIMTSTPNYKTPGSTNTCHNDGATNSSSSSSPSRSSLHKTAHNPISRKHRHHHHHHHYYHHHYHHTASTQQQSNASHNHKVISNTLTENKALANDSGFISGDDSLLNSSSIKVSPSSLSSNSTVSQSPLSHLDTSSVLAATDAPLTTFNTLVAGSNANSTTSPANVSTSIELDNSRIVSDSRTLAEASRNLTQTLRKLSKEVFTNKIDFSASEETPRKNGSGAVIESMKNHGKGIYSGTFSGTLNPALQDRYGRPKRDISTVIHILNDLLSATPQYHRDARISFEAPSTSAAAAASIAAASGTVHHSSRSKHLSSKHHQSSHHCVKCVKSHNSASSSINLQSAPTSVASGATNNPSSSCSPSVCTYVDCNGHYISSKTQTTKNYTCCQQDNTVAATSSLLAATAATAASAIANYNSSSSNNGFNTSNGHHNQHHHNGSSYQHHHHQMVDERMVCQCRYRLYSKTGECESDYTCQKCATELDNIKTKSKLDQLRLVMQQRKQKREARKLKGAPYGARVVGTTTTPTSGGIVDNASSTLTASNSAISTPISVATSANTPSEVSTNHLVEEVDTAA